MKHLDWASGLLHVYHSLSHRCLMQYVISSAVNAIALWNYYTDVSRTLLYCWQKISPLIICSHVYNDHFLSHIVWNSHCWWTCLGAMQENKKKRIFLNTQWESRRIALITITVVIVTFVALFIWLQLELISIGRPVDLVIEIFVRALYWMNFATACCVSECSAYMYACIRLRF